MNDGFFSASEITTTKIRVPLIAQCEICSLYKGCQSPKMAIAGQGRKGILVCGEAPGQVEDEQGKPFVGKTGQVLQEALQKYGINLFRDCHVTNSAICRPPNNKMPPRAVEYCRPNVIKAIKELKPEKVILVGPHAVSSVIGWLWKEDPGGIGRWIGWQIPCQRLNAWITPIWHPSWILREENAAKGNTPARLLWERHIESACRLEGRPYKEVPDYGKQVRTILDVELAARCINKLGNGHVTPIAFDYETNTLKPDSKEARITCCSISNGTETIAYPWHGEAIKATKELLESDIPKVGSNIKFETRFTLAKLGIQVRNWIWDTVLAAHVIDNRSSITSVKFQAFVLLGQESYDDAVKGFFKSDNSNKPNRIDEVNLPILLRYCGLDSLLEWHIAKKQMEMIGGKQMDS